jgi:hypothetical protein
MTARALNDRHLPAWRALIDAALAARDEPLAEPEALRALLARSDGWPYPLAHSGDEHIGMALVATCRAFCAQPNGMRRCDVAPALSEIAGLFQTRLICTRPAPPAPAPYTRAPRRRRDIDDVED